MRIAKVYIEHPIASLDFPLDYFVSPQTEITAGVRVEVELQNRFVVGYVEEIVNTELTIEEYQEKSGFTIKPIIKVLDQEALLNSELQALAHFLASSTLSPVISAYQTILPPALRPTSGPKVGIKKLKTIKVLDDDTEGLTVGQANLLKRIKSDEIYLKDVSSKSMLKKLEALEKIVIYDKEIYRSPYDFSDIKKKKGPILNAEQEKAINEVLNNDAKVYLLEGVTGSGKTEVYINLAIATLKEGKNVLILVPEISLTPAMVKRFAERIEEKIAVLHGSLSMGERYDEYRRIASGEAKIVIGARSAVFAPLAKIGLIVVDEEHSESYKQDNVPSYHVLDVVMERQRNSNCKVVLGSATPSLESKARAVKGLYQQLYLTKRINNRPLPKVELVDMLKEAKSGNIGFLSKSLKSALQQCLDRNEQAIILLNRRGYAISMFCRTCGHVFKCPNCGVALHYHHSDKVLKCHYCGYEIGRPSTCPKCKGTHLQTAGIGTQKVEEILNKRFNNARVIRMDIDSVKNRGGHQKILEAFESGKYNILLGTQMIAKGLDFPNVTLVGVLNADTALYCGDFRSNERTFQLLTQVVGRSGRGAMIGRAIIQTYNIDAYAINLAAKQDYSAFFKREMQYRHECMYPPYSFLVKIMFMGTNKDRVLAFAESIRRHILNESQGMWLEILGPVEPYIPKRFNKYRYRIMLKYKDKVAMQELLQNLRELTRNEPIDVHFDTSPYNEI